MTSEANRVFEAAMKLPELERAELVAILMDTIGDGSSPEEIQASWIAAAKRRLEAIERGESTPVALDDVIRRLRAKVGRPK